MPRIISCGFVIKSKDGKYLLGKTSQKRKNCWTFFKGQQEPRETFLETAIRELKEESNIDISSNELLMESILDGDYYFYKYRLSKKDVYLYFLDDKHGILDNYDLKCNSFYGENNPEIIDFKWFDLDELEEHLFNSQKPVVEKLKNMKKGKDYGKDKIE